MNNKISKVLVVVDMQNDFINGSLGTSEAQNIVNNVIFKICEYKKKPDSLIVFTYDTHNDNYLNTQEGFNLPVKHCIKNTDGWELDSKIENVIKGIQKVYIEKNTFGSVTLAQQLNAIYTANGYEDFEIELCGLCSDICVVSNALLLKAYMPEVVITVDANCTAGVTQETNQAALTTMKMCQINIKNWR